MSNKKLTLSDKLYIIDKHQKDVPIDTIELANDLGITVYKVDTWDDNIAGKIQKDKKLGGKSGYAIFVNGKHHSQRMRFTIAHEISHFILHQSMIGDGIFDDAFYRSNLNDRIELEANSMAIKILLPSHLIYEYIKRGIVDIYDLAKKFNVSKSSMDIRMSMYKR